MQYRCWDALYLLSVQLKASMSDADVCEDEDKTRVIVWAVREEKDLRLQDIRICCWGFSLGIL